ncbi:DUF805 domain-containing protein [Schumannella sp. 10F1B-5-1]|uniref:DUF805 domain-containing protein n=1 Tax=Schumannella sp. 10F1B-5-1 TaxID=2590780 RepID=UPI001131B636|nr:DUF805 domain-containing protein [Schumannella sp. 10F1B-5-1]TPW76765.1 DUF805 domain-containing protein [Schumannella sp. 10F1B-5-1]
MSSSGERIEPPLWLPYYRAPLVPAVRRIFLKYADFSGRAGRAEFWWWTLVSIVIGVALQVGSGLLAGEWNVAGVDPGGFVIPAVGSGTEPLTVPDVTTLDGAGWIAWGFAVLRFVFGIGTLIPGLAVTWRCLHDIDRSGAWYFIGFVPIVGAIVSLVFLLTAARPGGQRFDRPPVGEMPG